MKLVKTFEKFRHNQLQVIELSCEIINEDDIDELSYDDFEANLFINRKKITDISFVLDAAGVFMGLVDSVDWHKEFEMQYERKPELQLSLF
jgi:hypothetical protein